MKKIVFIFGILFGETCLFAASYSLSFAVFTSAAANTGNSFTAAASFGGTSPTPGKIVINEVYVGGDSPVEWVELFNSGGQSVDVSDWKITDNNSSDTFSTTPSIPPGGFAVIVPNGSVLSIPGSAIKIELLDTKIGNGLNNDGDKIILSNSSDIVVDQMGYGTNTSVFTGLTAPNSTHTLARIPNGTDTDTVSDWISNATPTPGLTN